MKAVKYAIKLLFLSYITFELSVENRVSIQVMAVLLMLVAIHVFKERYYDSTLMELFSCAVIMAAAAMEPAFGVLFCIAVLDLVYEKAYIWVIPTTAASVYFLSREHGLALLMLVMGLCVLSAFALRRAEDRTRKYRESLDEERRLRYELEQAKARLIQSARETASLAEIKERNRIARDIHDNIGHSIAGILIQLQASYKLFDRDAGKSRGILEKSIGSLSNSLEVLRDTVHNIRPRENLGVDYIKSIVEDFTYCPVDFRFSGDFNNLPANHLEILGTNIKEALTNTAKHSGATRAEVAIDINERFTRLYMKDNGNGAGKMKEGLGLSGMKERIWNAGGTISISSDNCFLIVCLIPREDYEGSGVFEGTHSR